MPFHFHLPAAALIVFSLAACRGGDDVRLAPDFALRTLSGGTTTLSSQKGRVVVLNFWATWCDSCREELPALNKLSRRHGGDGVVLLAVSVDEDQSKVPAFVASRKLEFPVLFADGRTSAAYAVRSLPTTYLIAPDGSIVRRYMGPIDARAVENDIVNLLHRRPS